MAAATPFDIDEAASMSKVTVQPPFDLHALAACGRKFGCIYADLPWRYRNQATRAATSNHYGSLSVEELCALPVGGLATDDAHLHLWVTNAFMFEAFKLFAAWGFEFRTTLVWVKPQLGLGNYGSVSV